MGGDITGQAGRTFPGDIHTFVIWPNQAGIPVDLDAFQLSGLVEFQNGRHESVHFCLMLLNIRSGIGAADGEEDNDCVVRRWSAFFYGGFTVQ